MQTLINRAIHHDHFLTIGNAFTESSMPGNAKAILLYLLGKPAHWQARITDLKNKLGLSTHAIKKARAWLQAAGYAFQKRLKSGHVLWFFYETQQPINSSGTPVNSPKSAMPAVAFQPVLVKQIDSSNTDKTTTLAAIPPKNNVVVVESNDVVVVEQLVYPKQLKESQKRAAKAVIKKAPAPVRQELLFALAYAITAGRVNNPVGYLTALVNRANDGTFEPVATPKTMPTIEERLKAQAAAQKLRESARTDNLAHFRQLFKQFGDTVLQAIPEQYRAELVR